MKLYKRNKLVHGIGVNDADYNVCKLEYVEGKQKIVWVCPYYRKWMNMLKRCYYSQMQECRPTYKDCTVCEDWHTFSNFKTWMEKQDWEGKALDKDFLVEGNKVYSPTLCVFIPAIVNSFVIDRGNDRGALPLGVTLKQGKYRSQCSDPFKTRSYYIGTFDTPEEAYQAWKERKHQYATELANSEYVTDERIRQVLLTKYL